MNKNQFNMTMTKFPPLADKLLVSKSGITTDNIEVDNIALKKATNTLRAMRHNLRQAIIMMLDEQRRLTVTEIYARLKIEQSVASQHLAILRSAGIVKTEREGKFIYYAINKPRISEIARIVGELN